ncbi:unnamed protein product [marine sediment metagenome]|uniref:Uncharacterized protein n=1 Tax=marine sediment metagenome TaxID=412755 RepID=X0RYH6_9ZZZZ
MGLEKNLIEDPIFEIAQGNVPDKNTLSIGGNTQSMVADVEETVWDEGGLLNILSTETPLYGSSDNISDIGISIAVNGVDGNFNFVTRLFVTNGQNQVILNAGLLLVVQILPLSATPQGNIYIATADAAPGGIPAKAKIQGKCIQGTNLSSAAVDAVAPGKTAYIRVVEHTTGKLKDIDVIVNFKTFGGLWRKFPRIHLAEAAKELSKDVYSPFSEKTIILLNAISKDDQASLSMGMFLIEVKNKT